MSRSSTTSWLDDLDHQASAPPSETVRLAAQTREDEQRKEADDAAILAEVSTSTALEFQACHAELTDTCAALAYANTELRQLIHEHAILLQELSAYRAQQSLAQPHAEARDLSPLGQELFLRLGYMRVTSQEVREESMSLVAKARMLRRLRRGAGGET